MASGTAQLADGRWAASWRRWSTIWRGALVVAFVAGASLAVGGPIVTYDVRAVSGGTGTPVSPKLVDLVGVNQTVRLELWAQVANLDHDHTNDSFVATFGSFISSYRDLLGDISNSQVAAPYRRVTNSPIAYVDLDGDGDLDLGNLATNNNAGPFFEAFGEVIHPYYSDANAPEADISEFLVGTLDFDVYPTNPSGISTEVNYLPRVRRNGPATSRANQIEFSDGQFYALMGDDPNVAVGPPVVIRLNPAFPPSVPEPSAFVLLGIGLVAVGAAGRRRAWSSSRR